MQKAVVKSVFCVVEAPLLAAVRSTIVGVFTKQKVTTHQRFQPSEETSYTMGGFRRGFRKPLLGWTLYSRRLLTELFSQPLYFDTNFSYSEATKKYLLFQISII